MFQSFSKWIIILEFNINRNYIARNLCENRYRPLMHCNGKCLLMKKMAAEDNQQSPAGTIKFNWEASIFIDTRPEYVGKTFSTTPNEFIPQAFYCPEDPIVCEVFHPPLT